jgi:serine/threonine protein kinase
MGSFGITYRALDEHLDTAVAIKEYYPRQIAGRTEASRDPDEAGDLTVQPHTAQSAEEFREGLQQFMEEGRTVARFDHPNVVDVKSYFEEHGTGYLVMDYYEGQTLADYLAANGGRLSEEEAVGYLQDVLDGLVPVHDAGVLHRDIDPQNIYLVNEGDRPGDESERRAILIDFGAAREAIGQKSRSLDVILKPGYAPFEQYKPDGNHGPWTDVYACAATLYKCLTGLKPPEATERIDEDSLADLREVRKGISMETSLAVKKGLAVRPERRPASAREFAELLGRTRTAKNQTQAPSGEPVQTEQPEVTPIEGPESVESHTAPPSDSGTEAAAAPAGTEQAASSGEFGAATVTGAGADGETEGSAKSLIGLAAAIIAVVGGTLLVSDAGTVEVLAYFGTWIAVCGGLIGLFRQGERLMTPEGRASISDWLLGEDFTDRPSNWPKTFTDLFDAVFTERHLSWTCFWRSALTSVTVVSLLIVGFIAGGLMGGENVLPNSITDIQNIVELILFPLIINVVVDYASLSESRWILGKMESIPHPLTQVSYLLSDLFLSLLFILIPVALVQITATEVLRETSIWTLQYWKNFGYYFLLMGGFMIKEMALQGDGGEARIFAIMAYSTLFTSVWVWLYVAAGLLIKVFHPVLDTLDWLKRLIDVESRPAEAMGFLLAVLTSVGFAISTPFVL